MSAIIILLSVIATCCVLGIVWLVHVSGVVNGHLTYIRIALAQLTAIIVLDDDDEAYGDDDEYDEEKESAAWN